MSRQPNDSREGEIRRLMRDFAERQEAGGAVAPADAELARRVAVLESRIDRLELELADTRATRDRLLDIVAESTLGALSRAAREVDLVRVLGLGKKASCPHCGKRLKSARLARHIRKRHRR